MQFAKSNANSVVDAKSTAEQDLPRFESVVITLTSPNGIVSVAIDESCGARVASLRIDGFETLRTSSSDVLTWGCYPMVPYAGRVRDARVTIAGATHNLPAIAHPHALHGTVLASPWSIVDHQVSTASLLIGLNSPWPVEGTVRHSVELSDDSLMMSLGVTAHDDMPCQVGWHPWFIRPDQYTIPFRSMLLRDAHGIATSTSLTHDSATRFPNSQDQILPESGMFDDCFIDRVDRPRLEYHTAGIDLRLDSDCSHWVVYDQRRDAVCFEPQSGAPNGVNDAPDIVGFGESLSRWFRISWERHRR